MAPAPGKRRSIQFTVATLLALETTVGVAMATWVGFTSAALSVLYILLCILVGLAAQSMTCRSFWAWTILSLLFNPLTASVFLAVAGTPLSAGEQMQHDRVADLKYRLAEHEEGAQYACPSCGNPVNLVTRNGLQALDDEPWRLICANCRGEIDRDRLGV
jgi:type VI protein secretion system component VasK